MEGSLDIERGLTHPLGARVTPKGVNFSLYSRFATRVELLLFDHEDDSQATRTFELNPGSHRTGHYWHIHVIGAGHGQLYGYRVWGPHLPEHGQRFDGQKVLVDPYAHAIIKPKAYSREAAFLPGDNAGAALKSMVVDSAQYDWEDDKPLHTPFSRTIIYELHVSGMTKHPNSGLEPRLRGTYRGLIEKIDYLKELGITAVELLPVFYFDETDAPAGQTNYWGYSPVNFFAVHEGYAEDPRRAVDEFRDMVKALHKAGIEVILDVVYNHTCEGDARGPTLCFRGIDDGTYYIQDKGQYANFSGCGNTFNANKSVSRRMIMDSLRYWVKVMHVDGFRFDLASILARDAEGNPMADPPLIWDIETDPVLANTKLIAEAWDAAGLYQVGNFYGDHWKEWNGQFRDDLRAFFRGDEGRATALVSRLLASPDIYDRETSPERSINFVTCHDGFTLNDLVTYEHKHNLANGEQNRDGADHNLSRNYGVEGPSDDPSVEGLRARQIRNFMTATLMSLGVPMILMGDEVRRTQGGNNNAYCQDNEVSWFDWSLVQKNEDLLRFTKELIRLRLSLNLHQDRQVPLHKILSTGSIRWHGVKLGKPDWSYHSHSIAFELRDPSGIFYVVMNAFWEDLEFELPYPPGGMTWRRLIDTSRSPGEEILRFEDAPGVESHYYKVRARSVLILACKIYDAVPNLYDRY